MIIDISEWSERALYLRAAAIVALSYGKLGRWILSHIAQDTIVKGDFDCFDKDTIVLQLFW